MGADYAIGPGQLTKAKVQTQFNPLEDDPDLKLTLNAEAAIKTHAGVWASVTGTIAIDAVIASVEGGLKITASASLDGGFFAAIELHYEKNRFTIDAVALIKEALIFLIKLEALIRAEAGIGPFKVSTEKDWELASFKYDPGIGFSISAPIHYASDETFKPPSLDDISFKPVSLDAGDVLKSTMAGRGNEKEK